MTNVVIQVPNHLLLEIKQAYSPFLLPSYPTGAIFLAKKKDVTITGYRSGKVMFQGKNAESESHRWGIPQKRGSSFSETNALSLHLKQKNVIGSDEVGTGDFFGPVVVCAAYVNQENIPRLKALGVRDSKTMKDDEIQRIARQIIPIIPHSVLTCPNEKYNDAIAKGMNQGQMKALLHNRALNNVLEKIAPSQPDAILIDQFVEKKGYYRYLKNASQIAKENVYFATKAEEIHLAVATASIIARFQFLSALSAIEVKLGIKIPKGAGAIVDQIAAEIIVKRGIQTLFKYTKKHFANTQKAKALAEKL